MPAHMGKHPSAAFPSRTRVSEPTDVGERRCYEGKRAIAEGLADVRCTDAEGVFRRHAKRRNRRLSVARAIARANPKRKRGRAKKTEATRF